MTEIDLESLSDVTGGLRMMPLARQGAINFSARENHVSPKSIKALESKSFGLENGRRYYGFKLDNNELVNVGLNKAGSRVLERNYVTDGL